MDSERVLKPTCSINNFKTAVCGGGVYIDARGIIATCNHLVVTPDTDENEYDIGVKLPGKDPDDPQSWIPARVLIRWPSVDLAIISTGKQNCSYVNIPKLIDLTWEDEVWAISNTTGVGSISDARVGYPFLPDTKLPEFDDRLTGGFGVSILEGAVPVLLKMSNCTPVGQKNAMKFHPNLPLIKVHRCVWDEGTSGCPLFLKKDYTFLGIMSFAGNPSGYYIPSLLIGKLYSIHEKEEGNACLKNRNYPKAIGCYSKSIDLYPNAAAFANRALVYLNESKYQEAENDCTESLKLDANNIKVYWRRAQARKGLGNLKEALEDVELGLKLEPENGQLKKLRDELKSMLEKVSTAGSAGAEGGPSGMDVKAKGI